MEAYETEEGKKGMHSVRIEKTWSAALTRGKKHVTDLQAVLELAARPEDISCCSFFRV
jgi:hypothetical protein